MKFKLCGIWVCAAYWFSKHILERRHFCEMQARRFTLRLQWFGRGCAFLASGMHYFRNVFFLESFSCSSFLARLPSKLERITQIRASIGRRFLSNYKRCSRASGTTKTEGCKSFRHDALAEVWRGCSEQFGTFGFSWSEI